MVLIFFNIFILRKYAFVCNHIFLLLMVTSNLFYQMFPFLTCLQFQEIADRFLVT